MLFRNESQSATLYVCVVTLIFQLFPSNGSRTRPNCWWKVPQTELALWRVPQAVTTTRPSEWTSWSHDSSRELANRPFSDRWNDHSIFEGEFYKIISKMTPDS